MADNLFSELTRMIDQVGKDKGIDKKIIIEAVETAMETAARKKFGNDCHTPVQTSVPISAIKKTITIRIEGSEACSD